MNEKKMLDLLTEHSGLSDLEYVDAAHVTEFRATRRSKDGTPKAVAVKLYDYVRGHPARYYCSATDEDGLSTAGNAEKDLETCLLCVHWATWT